MMLMLIGCIPYLIWMIVTAFRRKWRKLAKQVYMPLLIVAALYLVSFPASLLENLVRDSRRFDAWAFFISARDSHETERSFTGDGFSISVFELPDSIRERFENSDDELRTEYPKRPWYRSDWEEIGHWRNGPIAPSSRDYVDFALDGEEELTKKLRKSIGGERCFYAYIANVTTWEDEFGNYRRPSDIDFFVVDLDEGLVWFINSNT